MAFALLRRSKLLASITNSLLSPRFCKFSSSKPSTSIVQDGRHSVSHRLHLSPLLSDISNKYDLNELKIELVDDETWRLSSCLVDSWRANAEDKSTKMRSGFIDHEGDSNGFDSPVDLEKTDVDFDSIEDMRIRGNLFYKLDKDSKEYEECKFDFHRRKCSRNEKEQKQSKETEMKELNKKCATKVEVMLRKDHPGGIKKNMESEPELLLGNDGIKNLISRLHEVGDLHFEKKQRTPTFNQLTAPYHEPFCLDIHVTKGSIRASIIHRATSKVVVVSHSISKDMKFELGSPKNMRACAAVGKVLARRALADDIHNVVYTPRKGEKLEGKLQIVLKSIIDGGVIVKVKLKQKKPGKAKASVIMPHAYNRNLPV